MAGAGHDNNGPGQQHSSKHGPHFGRYTMAWLLNSKRAWHLRLHHQVSQYCWLGLRSQELLDVIGALDGESTASRSNTVCKKRRN